MGVDFEGVHISDSNPRSLWSAHRDESELESICRHSPSHSSHQTFPAMMDPLSLSPNQLLIRSIAPASYFSSKESNECSVFLFPLFSWTQLTSHPAHMCTHAIKKKKSIILFHVYEAHVLHLFALVSPESNFRRFSL